MILLDDQSIDARLADAHLKIITARDDQKVNVPLLGFGFTETKHAEGFQLYTDAFEAHKLKKLEYGEQFAATEVFRQAFAEAAILVMRHLKIGRVAFKNHNHLLMTAELIGERKATYTGWLGQTRLFYDVALEKPAAAPLLANFGLSTEILTATRTTVESVHTLKIDQIHKSGAAQEATDKRDRVIEVLDAWVSDLVVMARLALADSPQILEKMGIKVA